MTSVPKTYTGIDLDGIFDDAGAERSIPFEQVTQFPNGNLLLPHLWEDSLSVHLYDPHLEMRTCLQASQLTVLKRTSFCISQSKGHIPNLGTGPYEGRSLQEIRFDVLTETGELVFLPVQNRHNGSHYAGWSSSNPEKIKGFTERPDGPLFDMVKEFYSNSLENMIEGRMPDFAGLQSLVTFPFTTLADLSGPTHVSANAKPPAPSV